jgi:KaiC/GvpD/RAD55 family RecA-like ATPase
MTPLEAALRYAGGHFPVLPIWGILDGKCQCGDPECRSPGKHPIPQLVPHGLIDATTDEATLRQWFEAYPQANLAWVTGHGFFVLDIDPRHGGDDTLAAYEEKHGKLPPTREVLTGGGGRHLYFLVADGVTVRNGANVLGPGVDVRGEGGYVLVPPSSHVSGRTYEWEAMTVDEGRRPAIAEPSLIEALRFPRLVTAPAAVDPAAKIPEGTRNDTLARLAGTLRRRGLSADAIAAALKVENAKRCDPPLPDREVDAIARSVGRYRPSDPVVPGPSLEEQERAAIQEEAALPEDSWLSAPDVLRRRPAPGQRIPTGIPALDAATRGGFPIGYLVTFQGPPGIGKTALAIQIAQNAARFMNARIVALMPDEGREPAAVRVAQLLGCDRAKIEDGDPVELARFSALCVDIDIALPDPDAPETTLESVLSRAISETPAERTLVVVLDSTQMVKTTGTPDEADRKRVERVMTTMRTFAKSRPALVLNASQINRASYRHKDPSDNASPLSAGAETRAIEFVSDIVIHLDGDAADIITAKIVKNRTGGKISVSLRMNENEARLYEVDADGLARRTEAEEEKAQAIARGKEKVRRIIAKYPDGLTTTQIKQFVKLRHAIVLAALEALEDAGEVVAEPGGGRAVIYRKVDQ